MVIITEAIIICCFAARAAICFKLSVVLGI